MSNIKLCLLLLIFTSCSLFSVEKIAPDELLAAQDAVRSQHGSDPFLRLLALVEQLFQNKLYDDAITTIDEYIENEDDPLRLADLYWRRTKFFLFMIEGDSLANGKSKIELFDLALTSVSTSLEYDSFENHFGWFYKGLTLLKMSDYGEGTLSGDALYSTVKDCIAHSLKTHPDYYTAWSTLSSIARKEGDAQSAVAFDRKCVSFQQADYFSFLKLAASLYWRNWDSVQRNSSAAEQKIKLKLEHQVLSRAVFYEGELDFDSAPLYSNSLPYSRMSDREEATIILDWVIFLGEQKHIKDSQLLQLASQLKSRIQR